MTGAIEPAREPRRRGALVPALVGAGIAVAAGAGLVLGLGFAPLVGGAIGLALGGGAGLLFAPLAPKPIDLSGPPPATVQGMLDQSAQSAELMAQTMRRLTSRALWDGSPLDERLDHMIRSIRTLAAQPALRSRSSIDGDVQMLHVIATDYLPTIVNLAVENDRMHSTFSGRSSRAQVEQNIRGLVEQATILSEGLDQIETDVVKGATRSIQEHEAFLRSRFARFGSDSVLDLSTPMPSSGAAALPGSAAPTAASLPAATQSEGDPR